MGRGTREALYPNVAKEVMVYSVPTLTGTLGTLLVKAFTPLNRTLVTTVPSCTQSSQPSAPQLKRREGVTRTEHTGVLHIYVALATGVSSACKLTSVSAAARVCDLSVSACRACGTFICDGFTHQFFKEHNVTMPISAR